MNFELTDEQLILKNTVRNFVDKEIMPEIAEWDRAGKYDHAINQRLEDLGLMGVCIPEQYGGSGMDYNALALVCDEFDRGDTTYRISVHVLNTLLCYSQS